MNAIIKDFAVFTVADGLHHKSMPEMKDFVENGVSAVAYNALVGPMLKRVTLGGKFRPALVEALKKFAAFIALKGATRYLFYGEKFDLKMHAIDSGLGIIIGELWDWIAEGQVKVFFDMPAF